MENALPIFVLISVLCPTYALKLHVSGGLHFNNESRAHPVKVNWDLQDGKEFNDAIRMALLSGKPTLIGRLSCGAETSIMREFMDTGHVKPLARYHRQAGIYPATRKTMSLYTKVWVDALGKFGADDLVATLYCESSDSQKKIFQRYTNGVRHFEKPFAWLGLTPFLFESPWSSALHGKTVLIIHPFIDSMKCQMRRASTLFDDASVLPSMTLKYLKTVQAAAGLKPHANWGESLQSMYRDIDRMGHFDVALIAGGAFGIPLASHVKTKRNASAIMLGGASQLLFGLRGHRWDDKGAIVRKYIKDSWIYPLRGDTPDTAHLVEHGCYWGSGDQVLDACPV